MLKFVPITPEYGERYMQFYAASEEKSADYTFANLWCWKDKYRYEMAFADDLCWLRHYENGRPVYNPPIGRWQRTDWEQILRRHFPRGFSFTRVPGMLACILSGFFEDSVCLKEERDHFEYIYSIPELIALNGYRFRNKRKLSNQFKQYYNYIYKSVSAELIPDIKEFQRQWLNQPEVKKDKEHKTILAENEAVNRMLDDWQHLPGHIFGGVLCISRRLCGHQPHYAGKRRQQLPFCQPGTGSGNRRTAQGQVGVQSGTFYKKIRRCRRILKGNEMGFIKLTLIVLALSYLWLGLKCIYYLIKENFDF